MDRILTVSEMQQADNYTINTLGISKDELVFRAGSAVAGEILKRFKGGRVLVCIGKGNNGEDGKVVAQILSKKHGFSVMSVNVSNGIFKIFDKNFDIIVDCIFGTGLNKPVEGKFLTAIQKINTSGAYVVSCDIPSGLCGDTGLSYGDCVKANLTVAIQEFKLGHFLNDGKDYCGEVVVKDIGISVWGENYAKRFNNDDLKSFFPKRKNNTNKGDYGKVAIFGGSKNYPGSVMLSYNAVVALKMGVGYSTVILPDCLFNTFSLNSPECIIKCLKDDGNGFICDKEQLNSILHFDSIAFGMGVGISVEIYKIIEFLLNNYSGRLILDADALNTISKFGCEILGNHKCEVVLTPHIKEFSRLICEGIDKILENPITFARDFAKKYNVLVALKSATTIITDGKELYVNTTGNSGMAKAGSGDVLSGIMAGLATRKEEFLDCVAGACYLFGLTGDFALNEQNEYTLTASDIIKNLPKAINSCF